MILAVVIMSRRLKNVYFIGFLGENNSWRILGVVDFNLDRQ